MTPDPRIDASIIGELLLGELPEWYAGVCRLEVEENDDGLYVVVVGENDHTVERVSCDKWRESTLDENEDVRDLVSIAHNVNEAVGREHSAL